MSSHSRSDGPFALAQAVLGWILLVVVLLSAIPLGANRPVVWTLLGITVAAFFAAQVLLSFLRPTAVAQSRAVPVLIGYMAVVIWAYVQVAWPAPDDFAHPIWSIAPGGAVPRIGADPGQGQHMVLRLAMYGMVGWIILASALNNTRAWSYVRAIALFSTALAAFGLYAALTGVNPILGTEGGRSTVVSATFVNRNSYATYAAFGLFANVVVYLKQAGRGRSEDSRVALRNFLENFFKGAWIYALGALLCGAAIALTASRAGGIAALLGLVVLLLAMGKRKGNGPMLLGVMVVIMGFVTFALSSDTLNRFLMTSDENGRFTVFPVVYERIFDRPVLGQGIGAFHETFRAHIPAEAAVAEWDMAHNSYLENFYELGIPAAALLYLVLAGILIRCIAGVRTREEDLGLPGLALACIVTGGVHAMFDFSLQMPASAALFACILAIGWAQSFNRNDRASLKLAEIKNDL